MREKYTRLAKYSPRHYGLFLSVGVQSFKLVVDFETLREAEWTRDMLAIALANVFASKL